MKEALNRIFESPEQPIIRSLDLTPVNRELPIMRKREEIATTERLHDVRAQIEAMEETAKKIS